MLQKAEFVHFHHFRAYDRGHRALYQTYALGWFTIQTCYRTYNLGRLTKRARYQTYVQISSIDNSFSSMRY